MRVRAIKTSILGNLAERRAVRFLRRCGWIVVEQNVRAGRGEIDVVAVEGEVVVFVEVRFRSAGLASARESVDDAKARRLRQAVAAYRSRERIWCIPARIDIVAVTRMDGRWRIAHDRGAVAVDVW